MNQGAEWFDFYSKGADSPLQDDALILVTGAYMAQTWGAGYVHRRAPAHSNPPIEIALYRRKEDPDVYSWSLPTSHFVRKLGPQPDPNPNPTLNNPSALEWNQCFAIEGLTLFRGMDKTYYGSHDTNKNSWSFPGSKRRPKSHPDYHSAPQSPTSQTLVSPSNFFETFKLRWKFMTGGRSESKTAVDTDEPDSYIKDT